MREIPWSYLVHIRCRKTRMAGLQTGGGHVMIDSVVWAQYVYMTDAHRQTRRQTIALRTQCVGRKKIEGPRPRRRPKRTWREVAREDCKTRKLNKVDAVDRCKWRKVLRLSDNQDGWVGECFFWYWPTRVVAEQRPLNGCCCCCCSPDLLQLLQTWIDFTEICQFVCN